MSGGGVRQVVVVRVCRICLSVLSVLLLLLLLLLLCVGMCGGSVGGGVRKWAGGGGGAMVRGDGVKGPLSWVKHGHNVKGQCMRARGP